MHNAEAIHFRLFNHLPRSSALIGKFFTGYYALNYAHAGTLSHQVEGHPKRILEGPVAFWNWPGPRFTYGNTQPNGWDHYFVSFSGPLAEDWARTGLIPQDPAAPARKVEAAESFRGKMEKLLSWLAAGRIDRASVLLQDLFLDLHEPPARSETVGRSGRMIESLVERIRRNPALPLEQAAEASALGMSVVHFRRLFHEHTGLAPQQLVIKTRVDRAAAMLRSNREPLKRIAEQCGLCDEYYLSRVFRQHYGLPPGEYREHAQMTR